MRRASLVLVLWLSAAPAALAQSDPFTPILPATPTPEVVVPTPTPSGVVDDQGEVSRGLLLGVAGAIALSFIGIGVYVTRDARKHLTDADRRAIEREKDGRDPELTPEERRTMTKPKKAVRAKGKAQRQARKAGRKR